ncbi:hypothetical protein KRR55_06275 [Paeniglutamicibacter sp. ABSL32-1]|uniref:hypothetical protein n=1 Tax=Paeniglutamicibacter quisquiliarum TaxID=2849498 RepID=UPI001C2D685E|nr:hypothetical protein [Paeniglutamicibacter quisquiliarum]MBV1778718.1 hypothetical protein [Paeniglutamicibacter quisquiliarum]
MAGEITQEAIALALGGAGIGAGGAIIAQIIGGILTAKREKRKAASDRELWEFEAEAKRRDRSIDEKIEVFAAILSVSESLITVIHLEPIFGEQPLSTLRTKLSELQSHVQKLSILVPELFEHADGVFQRCNVMVMITSRSHFLSDRENLHTEINPAHHEADESIKIARAAFQAYVSHKPIPPATNN